EPRLTAAEAKAASDAAAQTRERFDRALDAIRRQRWAEAKAELERLSAASPADNRYRAYLHYVQGWDAFQLGRDGDARSEWQKALACDPGLGMARWALESTGLAR
ncbi:MAG TPA: hypothetical protein VHE35_26290, partial [Kofleriaceae bacterium]|nr:hypothetical protein [Kofleriaceae bacterium]